MSEADTYVSGMGFGIDAVSRNWRAGGVAAIAATLVGILALGEAAASTRATLQLTGRVPARAGVWLSQTASLFSTPRSTRIAKDRVWLTNLDVSANNKQFVVSVVSRNAETLGQPGLVDSDTGIVLPYRLILGGDELSFVDGEAQVAAGQDSPESVTGPKPLEIDMPAEASLASGHYHEQLLVVVTAR